MRAVVQRVSSASVEVAGIRISEIGKGLLVLLGVAKGDTEKAAAWMASKIAGLRIFEDADGKMNLAMEDVGGEVLLVSNFTVCGDVQKGRRPSFDGAAGFDEGKSLFELCERALHSAGVPVKTGVYGAEMTVRLENDGPVTLVIESP